MSYKRWYLSAVISIVQVCVVVASVLFAIHGGTTVKAAGSIAITGTVTNGNGVGISNLSVTADAPGTSTVEFGPTTTASDGSYTLYVDTGSYDFHFDPPSGSGLGPI